MTTATPSSPPSSSGNGQPSKRRKLEAASSPLGSRSVGRPAKGTPTKGTARTPVTETPTKSSGAPSPSPRRSAKRVSESLAAAVTPAHPQKRMRTEDSPSQPLPSFDDDVFGPSPTISREAFRANEARRRAREARNFKFDGDANAPRQTRSGRVIVEVEVDEYGGGEDEDDELEVEEVAEEIVVEEEPQRVTPTPPVEEAKDARAIDPLLPKARVHVQHILQTLTGREPEPAPFVDEESNDALQGIVSLLQGTVERGEGNSALVTGPRGVGKTRTVERALRLLPSTSKTAPVVVRLSGHAQTDDRRAIREMGRQIALGEGKRVEDEDEEEETAGDFAPTTLPSHLLALLTQPSPRAIIVIIDEFDLFTEHARQALLYCLLDVVQSVQTGPVETTGRGIAIIGVTSRVDTLLLLEKRVKSRFSHRVWRVTSPLAPDALGWKAVLRNALIPWEASKSLQQEKDKKTSQWMGDWGFAVDMLLDHVQVASSLERLASLTTDMRLLYRPFIPPVTAILSGKLDFLSIPSLSTAIQSQLELSGWGTGAPGVFKLRGLPHPALGVLIISKHLAYAGRTDFSLAQVEDEYLRFARTKLVGSGRARWPLDILRRGFDHCRTLGLLAPAGPATAGRRFAKFRATLSPYEVVAFFRGEGGNILGPELGSWGKLSGGHA